MSNLINETNYNDNVVPHKETHSFYLRRYDMEILKSIAEDIDNNRYKHHDLSNNVIVNVWCGNTGMEAELLELLNNRFSIIGVDIAEKAITSAKKDNTNPNIDYRCMINNTLSCISEEPGYITMLYVLETIKSDYVLKDLLRQSYDRLSSEWTINIVMWNFEEFYGKECGDDFMFPLVLDSDGNSKELSSFAPWDPYVALLSHTSTSPILVTDFFRPTSLIREYLKEVWFKHVSINPIVAPGLLNPKDVATIPASVLITASK